MLYIIHGTDRKKIIDSGNRLIKSLLTKKKNAAFFRLDSESFSKQTLEEFVGGSGLFEKKYIVHLDSVLSGDESEYLVKNLEQIAKSDNVFIFTEGAVNSKLKKTLEKHADNIISYDIPKVPSRKFGIGKGIPPHNLSDFNIFSISDAFGTRDKLKLWILYQKSLRHGLPPEEIHGILMWQVRVMLSVAQTENLKELDIKPFVISKAKKFLNNYSLEEVKILSSDLVSVYHNSRRGIVNFETGLEKVLLSV